MSVSLYGMGVARGVAIGRVHVLERDQLEIPEYAIPPIYRDEEIQRFQNALAVARQQLRAVREHIPSTTPGDIAAFIDAHLLMLEDAALSAEPMRLVRELGCNAEWALKLQRDALVSVFEEMDDPYLRTRKDDVDHVVNRIQRILLNQKPLKHEVPDSRMRGHIVLADDLTPADTVLMQHNGIAAFATEYGGPTSHTAILARSLGIPSIVGLHNARRHIHDGDMVIIDGGRGLVLVEPDEASLDHYRVEQQRERRYVLELGKLKTSPAVTRDGVPIQLYANIELPRDFDAVKRVGAAGVGLYRTEFLYMNRPDMPSEQEQFETYREVLQALAGIPVTIRTLDLGADKRVDGGRTSGPVTANPALGLRAVRLCLREPELFHPQLRAIIRASACGPARMMIPMLSNLQELHQVLRMVENVRADLRREGVPFDAGMPVGGMVEVPAAAVCADLFARHLDFLSIGTNDLIQYTLAIDRVNDEVNYLYDPVNPAVLRLVRMTVQAGERAGKDVSMCGEMASDPRYVRLLLALGLRAFSVHPAALPEVKRIVRQSSMAALRDAGARALEADDTQALQQLLDQSAGAA